MRVILNLSESLEIVPYTYKERCTDFLHDCVPLGDLHGGPSLFSFSNLRGDAKCSAEGINFPYGAQIFYNFHNEEAAQLFVKGVKRSPYFGFGMRVKSVFIQQNPSFEFHADGVVFKTTSNVLVKSKKEDGKGYEFLFAGDPKANVIMTRILNNKAKLAGIEHIGRVFFDPTYKRTKLKAWNYKGIINKTSACPVVVQGHPEILKFAWNVGIGNSTGIGFGALL